MALSWHSVRWLRTLTLSLAIVTLGLSQGAKDQCSITPLTLTWTNITVTQDGLGVARGIELGVGSPHQIFAFRPSTTLNNTRVNNVRNCGSAANNSCIGALGGVFDPQNSKSFAVSIKSQWNGSAIDEEGNSSYLYFNEDVGFQSQGDVVGYPLVLESQEWGGTESGLPLGTNSSFLRAAVAGGVAPSQVFGLWPGSRSVNPQDGELVIGGYDRARIAPGSNFTKFPVSKWDMKRPCPLKVSIKALSFGNMPLMGPNDPEIITCVEPAMQRFTFPPSVVRNFALHTGVNSTLFPDKMRYNIKDRPTGDLQITLSNGYKTTISNEEIFAPQRGSDKNGRYTFVNDTVLEAFVADTRNRNPNDVESSLGSMFLTFNYLMVDYAKWEFHLAPAVSAKTPNVRPNLITVCSQFSSMSNSGESKGASKGVIAGGVVGGMAGVAIITGLVFYLLRRKRRSQKSYSESWEGEPRLVPKQADEPHFEHKQASELSATEVPVKHIPEKIYEMPAHRFSGVVAKDATP
ncbi:hypothetical protein GQ44DRAFT_765039 [Phaeosphaeriaceae sp. PMI808]|nr:hypothetical protein GQ44DRAFT_765039 [Phaeosphaeriaceae sp. PMI808]